MPDMLGISSSIDQCEFATDPALEQAGFEPSDPLECQAGPDRVLPEHLP
jgi:hypothetical protein